VHAMFNAAVAHAGAIPPPKIESVPPLWLLNVPVPLMPPVPFHDPVPELLIVRFSALACEPASRRVPPAEIVKVPVPLIAPESTSNVPVVDKLAFPVSVAPSTRTVPPPEIDAG